MLKLEKPLGKSVLCLAALLLAAAPLAAQEQPEAAGVRSAVQAFYAALSRREMAAMEAVWAVDAPTVLINPRDTTPSLGWSAAKANWANAFDFWSDLKVTPRDMKVRVIGNAALVAGVALVEGRTKDGTTARFTALNTQVFEERGGKWLLTSHHSSRGPD